MAHTIITSEEKARIRDALQDSRYISGGTNDFYHYPARFSPSFASVAIESFSAEGDCVLDPFMGGGTSVARALALGRRVIGVDINALAHFVSAVRTTPVGRLDRLRLREWAAACGWLPDLPTCPDGHVRNLPRPVETFVAGALALAETCLRSERQWGFARCALLRLGQWALDCRDFSAPSARRLALRLPELVDSMLAGMSAWIEECERRGVDQGDLVPRRQLLHRSAVGIEDDGRLTEWKGRVRMVVTSPPYPGVHVLYHRWQYRGRRETPAPYWIANVKDGAGASYYTFGSRTPTGLDNYFTTLSATYASVKKLLAPGAVVAQLVAFTDSSRHMPRFLAAMEAAGYVELRPRASRRRLYRAVPNRRWYAKLMDGLDSASEVLLLHCVRG